MARPIKLGPLSLWATESGRTLVCEHAGQRYVYPLGTSISITARGALAWKAYRTRDAALAASFPYLPKG